MKSHVPHFISVRPETGGSKGQPMEKKLRVGDARVKNIRCSIVYMGKKINPLTNDHPDMTYLIGRFPELVPSYTAFNSVDEKWFQIPIAPNLCVGAQVPILEI